MNVAGFDFESVFPRLSRQVETYLAQLPPHSDPLVYGCERVSRLLWRTAIYPMFSMPDPQQPNTPVIESGQLIGVEIRESMHRFQLQVRPPTGEALQALNVVSDDQIALAHVHWHLAPDDFAARPGRLPPPTPFRPKVSQRFTMDGRFLFNDAQHSGFHGFAIGRTFPDALDGKPIVRLAAMVDILEGYGAFAGYQGLVGINGTVEPPETMDLSVTPMILDFNGHLSTEKALPALSGMPVPVPDEVFFLFYSEIDPAKPMRIVPRARNLLLAPADLPIRLLEVEFNIQPQPLSRKKLGPRIGRLHTSFWIGPLATGLYHPFQSVDGHCTFEDLYGRSLGAIEANILEGRAWKINVPGLTVPGYRFSGIGPIGGGTGVFKEASGMVSAVGVLSLFPRVMSVFYIVRLADPTGKFRERIHKSWKRTGPNTASPGAQNSRRSFDETNRSTEEEEKL